MTCTIASSVAQISALFKQDLMKLAEPLAIKDRTSSKCAQVFVTVVKREQKRSSNNALLSVGNLLAEHKPRPKPRLG